jgi:hypothetical protein
MFYGVHRGFVVDASQLGTGGRVQVTVPAVGGMTAPVAPVCSTCNCAWSVEAGDEVIVAFEGGDPARPIVLGVIQSGGAPPPTQGAGGGTGPVRIGRPR